MLCKFFCNYDLCRELAITVCISPYVTTSIRSLPKFLCVSAIVVAWTLGSPLMAVQYVMYTYFWFSGWRHISSVVNKDLISKAKDLTL